jgi:hypothetical protein
VVFIPGTASDLRQQLNIFARPLIEHFEVLSFDPRGIGQANSPDAAPTMIGERGADLVREPLRLAACLFRRERCAQRLHAIVSQQGAKPDDREHGKIRQ